MAVEIPGGGEHDKHYVPPNQVRWTQGPLGFLVFIMVVGAVIALVAL